MGLRTVFLATFIFILLTAALLLFAAGVLTPRAALESNLQSVDLSVPLKPDDAQPAIEQSFSGPTDPVESEATLQLDALSIMDSHCSACHVVQNLEKVKKSRLGWEKALAKMERRGVSLSEAERAALLDYLAIPDEP